MDTLDEEKKGKGDGHFLRGKKNLRI